MNLNYALNAPMRPCRCFGGSHSDTINILRKKMGSCSRQATVVSRAVHYRLLSSGKTLNFHQTTKRSAFLMGFQPS